MSPRKVIISEKRTNLRSIQDDDYKFNLKILLYKILNIFFDQRDEKSNLKEHASFKLEYPVKKREFMVTVVFHIELKKYTVKKEMSRREEKACVELIQPLFSKMALNEKKSTDMILLERVKLILSQAREAKTAKEIVRLLGNAEKKNVNKILYHSGMFQQLIVDGSSAPKWKTMA